MPGAKAFLDTNTVLYALAADPARKARAVALIEAGGTVSTQVLAESANVMRRKFGCRMAEIESFHDALLLACPVHINTQETIRRALHIADRYGFSIYDSLIIAAALEAGCSTLYSEDMQHGQHIAGGVVIINPFL